MPTLKKFLDLDGLIQLLLEIESLDETNIKDFSWSTDNADTYPTIVFKIGDDNGSAHSTKKITFKGDLTSPAPTGSTARTITLTIDNLDKTITYYDTTGANGITYSNASDSGTPSSATDVKTALDRVITKLSSIVGTDLKVRLTLKLDSSDYKMVMTDITTSGTDDEVEYTLYVIHNPSTRVTTFHTTSGTSTVDVKIENGGVTMGSGSINATNYTGTAAKATADASGNTITTTYAKLSDLAVDLGDTEGASLIGYSGTTVEDALDDIYDTIGGSGGSSIMDMIEDLQEGANIVAGTNVTVTPDTTNHQVAIAAADPTVTLESDISTTSFLPLLFGNAATPTSPGGTKYNTNMVFKPSTKELKLIQNVTIGSGQNVAMMPKSILFKDGEITLTTGASVNEEVSSTLTSTSFSGISDKARKDVDGNAIKTTYLKISNLITGSGDLSSLSNETAMSQRATMEAIGAAISSYKNSEFVVLRSTDSDPSKYNALVAILTALNDGDSSTNPSSTDLDELEVGLIYLLETGAGSNVFDEYIKVQTGSSTYTVEKIGTTDAGVDVVSIPPTGTNSVASLWETYVINA